MTTAIYSQHARQDTSTREHVLILVLKTLAKTAWLPRLLHRNMFCFVSALFGNWILSHFFVPSYISYITVFDLFDPFGSFVIFLTHASHLYPNWSVFRTVLADYSGKKHTTKALSIYMNLMFFSTTSRTSFQVWRILFTMKSCCYLAKSSHVY